jgi:hypothetical protein
MVSVNQIQQIILSFSNHRDPKRFVSEFSRLSFNIRQEGDAEAVRLARAVEAKLAHAYVGHASIDSLQTELLDMLHPAAVGYYYAVASSAFFNSANRPAVVEKAFPAAAAASGTLPAVVFGSVDPVRV